MPLTFTFQWRVTFREYDFTEMAVPKNLQVGKPQTRLYSADSNLAGAHADRLRQTFRALRNSLRYRCGRILRRRYAGNGPPTILSGTVTLK